GPSSLNRPHPTHSRAHRDFTAWRLIRDAFAVRERRGDPRAVPGFRCSFAPGMPSSTTPGSPIIDRSRAAMSSWPSPRVDRLGTPKAPAIRFARAMTFVASWFTHLLRPARLLAPRYGSDHLRGQRGLLLPGFQRDKPVAGYNYSSDWTPLLTGLSPARMAASLAAPTPSSAPTTRDLVNVPRTSLLASRRRSGRPRRHAGGRRPASAARRACRRLVILEVRRVLELVLGAPWTEGGWPQGHGHWLFSSSGQSKEGLKVGWWRRCWRRSQQPLRFFLRQPSSDHRHVAFLKQSCGFSTQVR